jgi:hypothetical protein
MPRIVRTILLLLLGLAAGSGLFEAYLRVAEATPLWRVLPVAEASLYGPSAEAGYTHRPGARGIWITESRAPIAINALGLRDAADRTEAKPAGARRFAIVGDSFVEALQVPQPDTFVARAEVLLSARSRIEVLNLGLAGATPAVLVVRARMAAERLGLDGLVVSVGVSDLLHAAPDDDSAFAGYTARPDGTAAISHAFRAGRGYQLRTGDAGRGIYWSLDSIRLALALNNRANAGLLADLAGAPAARARAPACSAADAEAVEALWRGQGRGFAKARLDAVLADLVETGRRHSIPVMLAVRGMAPRCPAEADVLVRARQGMALRLRSAGLVPFDVDAAAREVDTGGDRPALYGFGARLGQGHLNDDGHRVYARAFARAIAALLPRP